MEKSQGCKGTFWTRPSGKDVLVLKSCSTGWQHLQAVTGARNIAADDDLLILLLFAPLGWLCGFCNFNETTHFMLFLSLYSEAFESICFFLCPTLNAETVKDDFPCSELCWKYPMLLVIRLKSCRPVKIE